MQVIEELKRMSDARFLQIYEALQDKGFGPLDGEVAKALKFRPHAIKKLPMAQRAKRAKMLMQRGANAELAYEMFGTYLMKEHKDLVLGFLDGTGVEHEDGMISDVEAAKPDPEKVADTVKKLDEEHAPEDVTLYLSMAAEQWPSSEEVQAAWKGR
jgi:hypothetical protein